MEGPVRVKFLRDVFPLQENVEISGIIKFSSNFLKNAYEVVKSNNSQNSHFIFLIDNSYSMQADNKIDILKDNLIKLIDIGYLDESYVSIFTFGEDSELIIKYMNVLKNKDYIINKIKKIKAISPQTYAYKGFKKIHEEFNDFNMKGCSNKIIYFTDGEDFDENSALKEIKKLVKENNFIVTTVGVGEEYNDVFLLDAANEGLGGFYHLNNIDQFFPEIKDEIQKTYKEILTNVEIINLFYPSSVEIQEVYKVGNGVTKLSFDEKEIFCGNISNEDRIFFKLRVKNPKKSGKYNILNASIKYNIGKQEKIDEFSFKVMLSNDPNLSFSIDSEVVELNKLIVLYKKINEFRNYMEMNNEKEAKRVINEISPLMYQLSDDEDIKQIIDDIKEGKIINTDVTRTLLSYTKTKTKTNFID